jgi:hypothetical protein
MTEQMPGPTTTPRAGDAPAPPEVRGAPPEAPLNPVDRDAVDNFMRNPQALAMPSVESPFFETLIEGSDLPEQTVNWARTFRDDGYVVLENFFDPELIDDVCGQFPWLFDPDTVFDAPQFVQDLLKMSPLRRQDAWWVSDPIKRLACDERILALLDLFYGRKTIPFQTLSFLNGTEQLTHSDAIHFSSMPARFMCGVWVALEDITEENGPLHYYPGSHKIPDIQLEEMGLWGNPAMGAVSDQYTLYENYVRAIIRSLGLKQERLTVKKGTALIWSNGLLHGGSAILRQGSTRMSQVTHYYFENCVYWSPINSNAALGEYRLKQIHDLRTRKEMPHTLNGEALRLVPAGNHNHRIYRESDDVASLAKPGLPVQVLNVVEEQIRAVLEAPRMSTLKRAQTLAKLCDVALRAGGRGH